MSEPKLIIKEESSAKKTRSPPKKPKVEQSVPRKKKLKTDADKAAERAQHLRFGKAEITPDEASRMTKQQKRAMYAAAAARSAAHREVDQYEDDNVGTQALNEGVKSEEAVSDFSKNRYARKLKKKAKMQAHPAPAREAPTGFHAGNSGKKSTKATMPPPVRARRRRPQVAKRHPMEPRLQSQAWNRSSTKENLWSAPQSTALPILQKATRTFF